MACVASKNQARGLSPDLMAALRDPSGSLHWVLSRVHRDPTLLLEIRGDYVNVYYRGGSLFRICKASSGFEIAFDENYLKGGPSLPLPAASDLPGWQALIPTLKDRMDLWFGAHPKLEREYQQQVVRDNNFPGENSTDYFICDIEYDNRKGARFDLLGVRWPSTNTARQNGRDLRLAFIEMKVGDGAIGGSAGLVKHLEDFIAFLSAPGALSALQAEMLTVFNQKRELGLVPNCKNPIDSFAETPEILLLLANHDPAKSALRTEVANAEAAIERLRELDVEVRIINASFCGYAIYEEHIVAWDDFVNVLC